MISLLMKNFSFTAIISVLSITAGQAQPMYRNAPAQEYAERLSETELGGAILGMLALTADGDTIAALNPNTLLIPASNMKLVTTGLALHTLGGDYEYMTRIGYSGTVCNGTLYGDLYIIGGGDPTLASDDTIAVPMSDLFNTWTGFLAEAGIRHIDGYIIGDDRYFASMPEEQTWQWDDCGTYYGAGISGLTFYENMQSFRVAPGMHAGDPVVIEEAFPVCPWMNYGSTGTTGAAGTGDKLYYYTSDLEPSGEIRGTYAVDCKPSRLDCSNKFPAYTCASYFAAWLGNAGISCSKGAADTGYFMPGSGISCTDSLTVAGSTASAGLREIAYGTNHESNNVYAETLFNTVGREKYGSGDYASSVMAAEKLLGDLGADTGSVNLKDGSGLSRQDLLSPAFLCTFLEAMQYSPAFEDFIYSLPSPGSNGTMTGAMTGYDPVLTSRIRLKSGSMTGVKCFSGYIFPKVSPEGIPSGKPAVFSVMINNSLLSQYRMQKIIDRLIFLISAGTESGKGQEHQEL